MFSKSLQLVCTTLFLSLVHSVRAQATATSTSNGIVSAAGGPEPTQSVSYSIAGGAEMAPSTTTSSDTIAASATDATIIVGSDSNQSSSNQHGLTVPAILGITLAVVLSFVAIVIFVVVMYRRRSQVVGRAKRKSIMDMEFAASKHNLEQVITEKSSTSNIGYFDIAKPLPAVTDKDMARKPSRDSDNFSRSSTIIADAAEIAQINRKASVHQSKQKTPREQQRERNQALRILITNEDDRTTTLPQSPLSSTSTTPVDNEPTSPRTICPDGNGDSFAKRPSKI